MSYRIASAVIAALLAAPTLARTQPIAPNADGQVEFVMPNGDIGCTFTPRGGTATYEPTGGGPELSCSRTAPHYVTVIMGPSGGVKRIDNPGEQGCCSIVTKLAYGNRWARGPFACTSSATGLTCTGPGRHGFTLSRRRAVVR